MVEHYTKAEIKRLQRDFKRRSQLVGKALTGMSLDDAYILLTSFLHGTFDHLPDRTVEMMLIYIVTPGSLERNPDHSAPVAAGASTTPWLRQIDASAARSKHLGSAVQRKTLIMVGK
jgi:hypothetical protein